MLESNDVTTIGIGTTSNAYGKRYIGSTEPTVDVCDGDIWYDTSAGILASSSVNFTSDPVGTIVAWSGSVSSIPSGYQLCDGTGARTATLSAITGANVPDLRSRFIVGANDVTGTGSWPSVGVGSTGGSANSVVAAHDHPDNFSITANSYAYRSESNTQDDIGTSSVNIRYSTPTITGGVQETSGLDADGNENNTQSGTNANLPPYYALCYIIKHSSAGNISVSAGDKIEEGNTKAEVVDTNNGDGHFFVVTEGTERLRVTPHGFVGIGTTMPAGVLDIHSTTGDANVFIRTFSNNLGNTQIVFGDSDRNDSGKVQYNHPENFLAFHTNSSEQVRIDSSGNVGIGSTLPKAKLGVDGTLNVSGVSTLANAVKFESTGSNDGIIDLVPTRTLFIRGGSVATGKIKLQGHTGYDNIICNAVGTPGTTELHYAASGGLGGKRLETTGYGVSVYGTVAIGSSIYDSNGNLGSDGQVLSSVPGIGVSWTDQTGGSGSSGGGSLVKHGTVTIPTNPLSLTEAAFTNIPSTAKKITVSLYRFSYNTTDGTSDDIIMEVGDSSGYANSGYQSTYDSVNIVGNLGAQSSTTFYGLVDDTTIGNDYNITIELVNVSGNSWSISHQGGDSDDKVLHGGGSITLSNALDRLRKNKNSKWSIS